LSLSISLWIDVAISSCRMIPEGY